MSLELAKQSYLAWFLLDDTAPNARTSLYNLTKARQENLSDAQRAELLVWARQIERQNPKQLLQQLLQVGQPEERKAEMSTGTVTTSNTSGAATSGQVSTPASVKEKITAALKSDMGEAAWRVVATQFLKAAKTPIVAALQRQMNKKDRHTKARLEAFLSTPLGEGALAMLLSVGILTIPEGLAGETPKKISEELRVFAMANVGNLIADVIMEPLRAALSSTILNGSIPFVSSAPAATLNGVTPDKSAAAQTVASS